MKFIVREPISINELSSLIQIPAILIKDSNRHIQLVNGKFESNMELNIPLVAGDIDLNKVESVLLFEKGNIPHVKMEHEMKCYDSTKLLNEIEVFEQLFPFIKKEIIGFSVLGTPIIELKIGDGPKKIHMNGSFHANEWITTSIMMYWLSTYLQGLVTNSSEDGHDLMSLYSETTLSFVPMVNPDGVDLVLNGLPENRAVQEEVLKINQHQQDFSQWKANIRGVDLNNQYPANWEIEKERKIPKKPAPRDYPGDYPLSEPESIALADLVKKGSFDRVLAFHTQGEEIYWGYLGKEPDEAGFIVSEFERLSSYKAIRNIDSHAGFRDWFVNEYQKPGYTIELGYGVNPLPFEDSYSIYQKCNRLFLAALYL
ncbi:M14 family metallopeptidase [Metabacillus malikii]|uniref:G-D-glutamyl-meso-diaminopimelate peptidase n=1 Tax=Metabacillus malikii TaxID=1504265 RepID=A0ABT9ZI70_9BACI|nr:M14 family metallocarboxypeptidase [Metabacillus malikii]MDQ0231974.1 g-D-glutamyl-meso-diaminopimelate peptidase [Metabacillus malikii]